MCAPKPREIRDFFYIHYSIQPSGLIKAFYTSLPGRHIQSNTISTSLGSKILHEQLRQNARLAMLYSNKKLVPPHHGPDHQFSIITCKTQDRASPFLPRTITQWNANHNTRNAINTKTVDIYVESLP